MSEVYRAFSQPLRQRKAGLEDGRMDGNSLLRYAPWIANQQYNIINLRF